MSQNVDSVHIKIFVGGDRSQVGMVVGTLYLMHNIAVKSSAGSGKTYELAKRFLSLYLNNFPLESLYGITFTNKAALEMKERIIHYLDVLVNNNPTRPDEIEVVKEFREEQNLADRKRKNLLNNLSSLNISTFHSLFASFLSTLPFEAGILPGYDIIDDTREDILLNEVLENFFEKAYRNEEYRRAILELVYSDERRVKENISRVFKGTRNDIEFIRENLGDSDRIEKTLKRERDRFKKIVGRFLSFIEENKECAYTAKGTMNKSMEKFVQKVGRLVEEEDWRETGRELMGNKFLSKNYFKSFTEKLADRETDFNLVVHHLMESLSSLIISLSKRELYIHIKPIYEIDRMLQQEKFKRNFITFDDIEKLTWRALKSGIEYLYFKIGARINHLMIDEFQDTSVRQWEVLKPLVDEVTSYGAEEKSLFYVGDPNQAIFRWRGGEERLFDFVKKEYEGKIDETSLDINHRSKSAIVNFVNTLFGREDKYEKNNTGGWVRFESVESSGLREGRDAVRKRVVEIVKRLKKSGYDYDDIAVLVRDNNYGVAISELFNIEGIPCISESKADIFSREDTRAVINLMRFLECPEDDFSLSQVLLSQFFGMREDTLAKIKKQGKSLYLSLIDEHPDWDVSKKLKKLLSMVGFSTPYEMAYRIYEELNLPMTGSLSALLEAALSYTSEEILTLSSFIDWIGLMGRNIKIEKTEGVGVKILTIHKAKGLEFPVVIIPDTVWRLQEENKFLLYRYNEREIKPCEVYWASLGKLFPELVEASKKRVIEDEKKVLYVALTRAIEGLYILGFDWRSEFTWFGFIKGAVDCPYEIGEIKTREKPPEEIRPERRKRARRVYSVREEKELYSPTERGVEVISAERREKMELGDIVHKALSRVGWIDRENIGELTLNLLEYVKSVYARKAEDEKIIDEKVREVIYDTLTSPDFQFAFKKGERDIRLRVEVPAYFEEKGRDISIRIDRLLIEPRKITIIDYKTGKEKEEDIKQLRLYKEGMGNVFPGREIEAWLFYIEQRKAIGVR